MQVDDAFELVGEMRAIVGFALLKACFSRS